MRLIALLSLCAGIALTVGACDPVTDRQYFREGVGANLYTEDIVAQTEVQSVYVNHICQQAGLDYSNCGLDNFNPAVWSLFVQAGMNDIDQRCDAYLTWLDNVRRAQAPTIKQIGDAHTATELIMQAVGVGAAPIAVAGAAFGFAASTFTNVTSRLILDVNHATVQAVVLGRQKKYREDLFGTINNRPKAVIASRPAAIYALRSYLRMCMPMTIETEITNTIVTFERGGADALKKSEPMISAKSVGLPLTARQAVSQRPHRVEIPPNPTYAELFVNYTPAQFRPSFVKRIQVALCVPASERGTIGEFTRSLIDVYKQATRQPVSGKLSDRDVGQILSPPTPNVPCSESDAKNYYERITYTDAEKVADLITRLNKSPAGGILPKSTPLAQARAKIKAVRSALFNTLSLQLPDALGDQMTRDLDNALFSLN